MDGPLVKQRFSAHSIVLVIAIASWCNLSTSSDTGGMVKLADVFRPVPTDPI